jgi:holin-like protein
MRTIKSMLLSIAQVGLLFLLSMGMNVVANALHLPIPGTILGIIILFILLKTEVVKLSWIELGGNWLLAELLLFFIPSAVGVMKYIPILENQGLRILVVVIISTFIVMLTSGLTATRITKRKERGLS